MVNNTVSYLGRLNGVILIVHRRRWTGHVVNLINLCPKRLRDVMTDELKVRSIEQVLRANGRSKQVSTANDNP